MLIVWSIADEKVVTTDEGVRRTRARVSLGVDSSTYLGRHS